MRFLSLIIAAAYVLLSLLVAQSLKAAIGQVLFVSALLMLPLACIWFADEVGSYPGALPGPSITKQTPAAFVKVGGWILLMLPLVAYWLMRP
jgi:hypothetical protein